MGDLMSKGSRDPVMVLCGEWSCSVEGSWNFVVDKKMLGRCVNIGTETRTHEQLVGLVKSEFAVHMEPILTYWIQGPVAVCGGRLNPPLTFTTDEGFENFRAKRSHDHNLSLFVSFEQPLQLRTPTKHSQSPGNCTPPSKRKIPCTPLEAYNPRLELCTTAHKESVGEVGLFREDEEKIICLDDDEKVVFEDDDDPKATSDCEPTSDAEFEDSEGDTCFADKEYSSGEEPEYDYNEWSDLINKEFEDVPLAENQDDATVQTATETMGSYIPLSLQNLYKDIRDEDSFFATDAAPVFDVYEDGHRSLCDIDIANEEDSIYKGRVFKNKKAFKLTMAIHAIKHLFHFRSPRSTKQKCTCVCVDPRYDWYVLAVSQKDSDYFEVRKAMLVHNCTVMTRDQYTKHATAKVISQLMKSKYGNGIEGPRARDLTQIVLQEIHVSISYWKSWRSRELALELSQGSAEGSYGLLPVYLHLLKKSNPGTVVKLHTTDTPDGVKRFKYLFLAMGASVRAIKFLRKVVVVDGTQLTGKYRGCLMTASMQDGNFQIFPIGFSIVDSENDASWEWFFTQLHGVYGEHQNLVFVSDRHASIRKGIAKVFKQASHGCCHVHLERNVSAKFHSKGLSNLVGRACKAFRLGEYNSLFAEIEGRSPKCAEYLTNIGIEHWSRVHSVGKRYNLMSSNIAESLNDVLQRAKGFPIVSMIDYIRTVMMRWFSMRRGVASRSTSTLTPNVEKHLVYLLENQPTYTVTLNTVRGVELRGVGGSNYNVNLSKKTCSCMVYDTLGVPCRHAYAAATVKGLPKEGLVTEDYSLETWKNVYRGELGPVPDANDVVVEEALVNAKLLPPLTRTQAGRRRKERIPSTGEFRASYGKKEKTQNKCGRCHGVGHNK